MSISDYLKFEYPLPDPEFQAETFPLKEFEWIMDTYIVTKAGRLVLRNLGGFFEETGDKLLKPPVDTKFHGNLIVSSLGQSPKSVTYEVIVRFTVWQLTWLKTKKTPNLSYSYLKNMLQKYPEQNDCIKAIVTEKLGLKPPPSRENFIIYSHA